MGVRKKLKNIPTFKHLDIGEHSNIEHFNVQKIANVRRSMAPGLQQILVELKAKIARNHFSDHNCRYHSGFFRDQTQTFDLFTI